MGLWASHYPLHPSNNQLVCLSSYHCVPYQPSTPPYQCPPTTLIINICARPVKSYPRVGRTLPPGPVCAEGRSNLQSSQSAVETMEVLCHLSAAPVLAMHSQNWSSSGVLLLTKRPHWCTELRRETTPPYQTNAFADTPLRLAMPPMTNELVVQWQRHRVDHSISRLSDEPHCLNLLPVCRHVPHQ